MGSLDKPLLRRNFLKQMLLNTAAISAAGTSSTRALAQSTNTRLLGARVNQVGHQTQVTLDLSEAPNHHVFVLHHPERVVIDLAQTGSDRVFRQSQLQNELVVDMRSARRHQSNYRVVLDLRHAASVSTEMINPAGNRPHYQLVIRLSRLGEAQHTVLSTRDMATRGRDLRVVIDPGHGGKDPGAIGKHGTEEKNVVLDIARRLYRLLSHTQGIKVTLTRRHDHFLHLNERVRIAERHKADLFLSIHADANTNRTVKGSSAYILSEHGASSVMARKLAERENSADPIGNINLGNKSPTLAKVLLDLSQTATIQASADFGSQILKNLSDVDRLLSGQVERAAFVVLTSPDIPSALVETAFISNPNQERRLRTPRFQRRMAHALHDAILDYFRRHAPPDSLLSASHANRLKS